jgi:magnesium transporter
VRPQAILLNLLHLKVLIKYDRVLLFDVYGSKTSYPQSAFMYDLQGKLQQKQTPGAGGLPYEFRALEAVLTSVTSELEAEFETVQAPVIRILSELEDDIDRDKLRILLVLSKKVSSFEQKAKLVRDAIEELLEADDDLSAMYLTEKTHDLHRQEDDHTEIEMLLEAYDRVCDEVAQEASNLVSSIRNTEEM